MQNLTFVDGNSKGERPRATAAARSSCAAAGSRSSTRASSTTCATTTGPDVGGAAVRVFSQYEGLPVVRREQHVRRRATGSATRARTAAGCQQHRRLVDGHQQPVHAQPRDRQRRQPGASRHARRRQRRRDLQRRQHDHAHAVRHAHRATTRANEGGSAIFFVSNDRTGTLVDRGLGAAPTTRARGFETDGLSGHLRAGEPATRRSRLDDRIATSRSRAKRGCAATFRM